MSIRDEFEAWWEINYHNGNPPRFGWAAYREDGGYKIDDDESELDSMWNAWQAATSAMEAKCSALAADNDKAMEAMRQADEVVKRAHDKFSKMAAETHGFKRFFMFAINAAFDGCDIAGDQIQEVAKEIGLVRVEPYSAEKHADMSGDPSIMEEGDDFYIMNKTPATDAFLAEVRAQARNEGINYAASRLAAAFNHGFVDKPLTEVCDVVHMILDTKEELANSTLPAADGLSGEYAEKFLEESAAQLRQDANTAELVDAGIITKVGE